MEKEIADRIASITREENEWRRGQCINLIASESVMSPAADAYYVSDFAGRYNEHDSEVHYQGTRYSMEMENLCNGIFAERFQTSFVDTRPIAGGVANLIAYTAFAKPGDSIVALGIQNGAHVSSTRWGMAGVRGLNSFDMVFDKQRMNIDVDATVRLIRDKNPKLIMFGGSMLLFPEPIREIKDLIDPDIKVVYDAAHVFGLIYNGRFQQPLIEGADVMTSSTHKTFQGPQGGIIIGRSGLDGNDWLKVQKAIFPGTLSNHHIHRLPSLAMTALEMNVFGREYADQTIKNAKTLAQSLSENGFDVLCPDLGFTESHQVIVDVRKFGGGKKVAEQLERNNIICNKMSLPTDAPQDATKNPSGIRLGTQEMTRWGMREINMREIGSLFRKILAEGKDARSEVSAVKRRFEKVMYCFETE